MKRAISLLLLFNLSCAYSPVLNSAHNDGVIYYNIQSSFSAEQKQEISKALVYFENNVGCLSFKYLNDIKHWIKPTILIDKLQNYPHLMEEKQIGRWTSKNYYLLLSNDISSKVLFITTLHELAHAFTVKHSGVRNSILSPKLGIGNNDHFTKDEIRYLKRVICKMN